MESSTKPRRKIGLLFVTAILAAAVWLVGGTVLLLMLHQQTQIQNDAQHIYDVSSPMVFESTRMIRGFERLAREGESILWSADPEQRANKRQQLNNLVADAVLQSNAEDRALITSSFATMDENLADLLANGAEARPRALARWTPLMQSLLNRSEAVGAQVSDLAVDEADNILQATDTAREMLLVVTATLALVSVLMFAFLYLAFTRPVVRLAKSLQLAREGQLLNDGTEFIREMQMLNDAAVALARAHSDLETTRGQLELLAHTDALTGLANRRMFEFYGNQTFEQSRRYDEQLSVIVFDIDHFKRVNDRFGHAGGDVVLRALGTFLQSAVRGGDRPAARMGGEEFALLLSHAPIDVAHIAAERFLKGIGAMEIAMPNGECIHITSSLGVAQRQPGDTDLNALMHRADVALYRAKEGGRNRVELAD